LDQGDPRLEATARLDGLLANLDGLTVPRRRSGMPSMEPIPGFLTDPRPTRPHVDVEERLRRQILLLGATPIAGIAVIALGFLLR